jgi:hypothetical protein
MNINNFKLNLIAILIGTNIGVIFLGVSLEAATFSLLVVSMIAYIIRKEDSAKTKDKDGKLP